LDAANQVSIKASFLRLEIAGVVAFPYVFSWSLLKLPFGGAEAASTV